MKILILPIFYNNSISTFIRKYKDRKILDRKLFEFESFFFIKESKIFFVSSKQELRIKNYRLIIVKKMCEIFRS